MVLAAAQVQAQRPCNLNEQHCGLLGVRISQNGFRKVASHLRWCCWLLAGKTSNVQVPGLLRRFLHDIAFGMSIVARGLRTNTDLLDGEEAQPQPQASPKAQLKPTDSGQQPLQLLLHISNLSVLLPASSRLALMAVECGEMQGTSENTLSEGHPACPHTAGGI